MTHGVQVIGSLFAASAETANPAKKVLNPKKSAKMCETKACKICGEEKPLSAFVVRRERGKTYILGMCKRCRSKLSVARRTPEQKERKRELDHLIPLSIGGSHTYDNVKTCCMLCNSKRSNNVSKPMQIGLWCQPASATNRGEGQKVFAISGT